MNELFCDVVDTAHLSQEQSRDAKRWTMHVPEKNRVQRRAKVMSFVGVGTTLDCLARLCFKPGVNPMYLNGERWMLQLQLRDVVIQVAGVGHADRVSSEYAESLANRIGDCAGFEKCPLIVLIAMTDHFWKSAERTAAWTTVLDAVSVAVKALFEPNRGWTLSNVRNTVVAYLESTDEL